jgi:hypothetical protein
VTDFKQDEVLWESDRSFGEKAEQLRLEKGEYQGKPTYSLRLMFKNRDGDWRWSQVRADSKGRHWASLNLRAKELPGLLEALQREIEGNRAGALRDQAQKAEGKAARRRAEPDGDGFDDPISPPRQRAKRPPTDDVDGGF